MAMAAISDDEPELEEVINGNESDNWKGRMEEELSQIEKLNTWELVQAPPDANIVPSKWMLHHKCNAQGKIACYQARIVTKGYVQIFGRDFKEMFAPTICSASLHILLLLAASKGLEVVIKQADIKNAYLNAFLNDDEVIYLSLPPYYELFHSIPSELSKHGHKVVLRLCCPLYGTKQGAHHWYQELKQILISLNFKVSQANEALFYCVKGEKFVIMAITTDNFTIVADSPQSSTW